MELEGQGVRCGGHRGVDVTDLLEQVCTDVVRDVLVDQVATRARRVDADHDGQLFVGHPDALGGVLGDVPVTGDHHDDGLADVVHLVLGQGVARAGVGEGRVGDEDGKRLRGALREVLPRVDPLDAVDLPRVVDVDVGDPGVGVRAADEGGRQGIVAEVVEIAAVTREEPGVLTALDPLAELAGAHVAPSARARPAGWPVGDRRISAARQTAVTMFW